MRATIKPAESVAILGYSFSIEPTIIKIILPIMAKRKLLAGVNNKLEIVMGMKKTKVERPLAISAGVSLNVNATVSKKRKRKDAYLTERRFRRKRIGGVITPVPNTIRNKLFPGLDHDQFIYKITNTIRKDIKHKINVPIKRILSNRPRRTSLGFSVENVFQRFHNVCTRFMVPSLITYAAVLLAFCV
jgi:hypothetical protein